MSMAELREFYEANAGALFALRDEPMGKPFSCPLLMDLGAYFEQPLRLFIVGQETYGWNSNRFEIESILQTYRNFNLGKNYFSSPFWNITRKIEKMIGIAPYSCAWSNLNRCDYNGGPPKGDIATSIARLDYFVKEEIRLIRPDICILFTNRKYDDRLRSIFSGVQFLKIDGLPFNHFCRLVHKDIPDHTYRTPHPRTIRTRRWEAGFISVMDSILPKNTTATRMVASCSEQAGH